MQVFRLVDALAEYQKQEFVSKPLCFYDTRQLAHQKKVREELESIRFMKANRFVQQLKHAFLAKLEQYKDMSTPERERESIQSKQQSYRVSVAATPKF